MNKTALQILKTVGERGETSLANALRLAKRRHSNHIDQYPLALLLDDGYVGSTVNYTAPSGMEEMREFALAITLHMHTLPKEDNGTVRYLHITTSGHFNAEKESVFLKAKGALYLEEHAQRRYDRVWSLGLGFAGGVLAAVVAAWLKGQLRLA